VKEAISARCSIACGSKLNDETTYDRLGIPIIELVENVLLELHQIDP
jgi:hypothetical protein